MSKIFLKIDFKFYFNVITYDQTYKYDQSFVGLKDLAKPNPFYIKPKAHTEEEEVLEDE